MATNGSNSKAAERLISLTLLVVFACATIYGTLEVRFPEAHQEFFLRVFTSLAAAAIAAIIPGVFEFETKMLASAVRASGALAVFALVYLHSPPPLNGNNEQMAELEGTWYYIAETRGPGLAYGAKHYGGVANFDIQSGRLGPYIKITATVGWKVDEERNELVLLQNPTESWFTTNGAVSGPDQLIYQYVANDGGKPSNGFTSYQIVRGADGQISALIGSFQRTGSDFGVLGEVQMCRQPLNYESISKQFGVMYKDFRQPAQNAAVALPAERTNPSRGAVALSSCDQVGAWTRSGAHGAT